MLNEVIINIAWAGRFFTLFNLLAPKYCDIIAEIALLVCPKTQINMDKKVVTIPTAAKASVAFVFILPTIAASVSDKIGSAIPDIKAGIANCCICLESGDILKKKALYKFWQKYF